MKKYLKVILLAILIGVIIAFFFYKDINKEVKAITNKTENIYLFQVGVFKNLDNAKTFANTFKTNLVFQNDDYYRVITAISYNEEAKIKMEAFYQNQEINYFIKEMKVNKDLIKKISNYETVLIKSNNEEVINNIMNSILLLFDSYI